MLCLRGRGVCDQPWNFPLAIFSARSRPRLMAGNAVLRQAAEQTPLIAAAGRQLLHEAGVPASALHLVHGRWPNRGALVARPEIAGVVFTGSTEVARTINRALAAKDGPIVPLIAETGGINAMIVDATALPEQVADDVVTARLPLRRPALLGAAAAVRAGRRRRPRDRDDRGRGARACYRRSLAIPPPISAR